jgi:thymidylate synthase
MFLRNIRKQTIHPEYQYLQLIKDVLTSGEISTGRNGVTRSIFGATMRFPLANKTLPLLTTKKLAWKICLKELLWFMNGSTSNHLLKSQNVHIWDKNGERSFLDQQGLQHYEEDDLGPIYGHQWRHFNAPYIDAQTDYSGRGVDQLQNIIDTLKHPTKRYSRRLILSAWNPLQISEMALPPCHILMQFNVNKKDELSCCLYQRSGDIGLGVPFNIASYSFLTHILATHCGLKAKEFIHFIGNAHIYDVHGKSLEKQLLRQPLPFSTLQIKKETEINDYTLDHIQILNYKSHPIIKMDMIA